MKRRVMTWMMAGLALLSITGAAHADAKPKLVILISIDQFSADLFNAYRGQYRAGLKELSSGIVYPSAYHEHGVTETCAGHAVIATGNHPNRTGIIANEWFDGTLGKDRYCTDDAVHVAATAKRVLGVGPGLLEVSTIGDWLKSASPASRVFSVAGKDRSAIMMGGHKPDGAFWFDGKQGFDTWGVTVDDARTRLTPLAPFNAKLASRIAQHAPIWTYFDKTCKTREAQIPLAGGKTFNSHLPPDLPPPLPGQAATTNPILPPWFYDTVTLEAAVSLIASEKLGHGQATDILAIGLSGTDMVGHVYGSQGPEMCDQIARLDDELGRFLKHIKALGVPVLIAVTADHGGSDIPERLNMRGYPRAERIEPLALLAQLNAGVRAGVGIDWDPLRSALFDPTRLTIVDRDGKVLGDAALRHRIADETAARARTLPGVAGAWTADVLQAHPVDPRLLPDQLSLGDRMALSFYPARTADVSLLFDPMVTAAPLFPGRLLMGHSGASDLNRRVPMLFWWPGVASQERAVPVAVTDLAPTLAAYIGVQPDGTIDGRCLNIGETEDICARK
ncbi:alkaline phosphatase family protein [Govanella unica]|uniref:Alkaline phosphatase family protein n=1 Tax=Govanella unica TaxID=2975056 RepID=A0A9X3Z8E5_9PROT|nr:alkaline phosphatase family protein [Govania unica]MDA5195016.1 alkaline phosphatase family protein [Govania unica]